jgi:multidrug efflux pump subunit AcrB
MARYRAHLKRGMCLDEVSNRAHDTPCRSDFAAMRSRDLLGGGSPSRCGRQSPQRAACNRFAVRNAGHARGGQFEYLQRAEAKLKIVVPATLVVILVLLFLNFGRLTETLIVMLSVPFALVGGAWLMWWLDYNMSVAVAVGFIALAGVAAETGVVMLIYLDHALSARL